MKKAAALKPHESIADIVVGNNYLGIYHHGQVKLNKCTLAKTKDKAEDDKKVMVTVTKVSLPDRIECTIIDEPYEESSEFLVASEVYGKLKPRFDMAVKVISKAIAESRPIFIKHNADCDGYCGALALEWAILPLLKHIRLYRRAPTKAPYYSYEDASRDVSQTFSDRITALPPLIIIVDNGSTDEDAFGIRKVKIYGCPVIVIDHHDPDDVIDSLADAHINPHLEGGSHSITAGMLCVEVAAQLNRSIEPALHLAAISGYGDRSQCLEMEQYVRKSGMAEEYMKKIAECVDFEAFYLKHMEARGLADDLLGKDKPRQKALIELICPEIERRTRKLLDNTEQVLRITDKGGRIIAQAMISDILDRGEYPPPGKATGMIFDYLKAKYRKPVIMLGVMEDMVIVRSSDPGFDLNRKIEELKKTFPGVEGGGHACAGTIKIPCSQITKLCDSFSR